MRLFHFTIECNRNGNDDVCEHYVAAYSYDHAHNHVKNQLEKAGYEITKMTEKDIFFYDIRDKMDQITYEQ